jgi:diacylglycerol kinase family enzyme
MRPIDLQVALERLVSRCPAFSGESLAVDIIANPQAGGFTRPKYAKRRLAELKALELEAQALPVREGAVAVRLFLTERSGHAADIARGIVEDVKRDASGARRIIVTAGGDGTSLETASVLVNLPGELKSRIALLRLPFGTGNDGSEGRDLTMALGRFLGPLRFEPRRAVRVIPAAAGGKPPLYSFNIAGVGADAFICHMTNKLKAIFPGDSFKFWVDFSSVFYDRIWPAAPLTLRAFDAKGAETFSITRDFLLLAVGVSGRRTFGSGQIILPDEDNACIVFQMSLFKKLKFKELITSGQHRGFDVVRLFSGGRFELDYAKGILLERDGEVDELTPADFPLVMEITEPCYNVLMPNQG